MALLFKFLLIADCVLGSRLAKRASPQFPMLNELLAKLIEDRE